MMLQDRLFSTHSLAWPTDWPTLFGTPAPRPLIVEIGFGYGHMLFHLAETRPEAFIVGVEVASKPQETVERRLFRRKFANVRVIHGYAETLLHHVLQPATVDEFHINFPDPWFKAAHAQRRVIQRDTLDAIVNRLKPGGMFYLATDITEYAEMVHEHLIATPTLTNQLSTAWGDVRPHPIVTKYEAKALAEGRTNKYFTYRRNDLPAPAIPVMYEVEMPNIVFKTALPLTPLAKQYTERVSMSYADDIHVNVMAIYEGRDGLLFEVYVKEPTIEQHVSFAVFPHDEDRQRYTLKLGAIGYPRPTEGMHRAAAVIEGILQGYAPDYEAIHRKIRLYSSADSRN
jgi:tRNA (guanine-N7-)-methyltransferase